MATTVGDTRPVPGKLCRGCGARGEWPGQPCPKCKPPSPAFTQRRLALEHANQIRTRRRILKADLRDGRTSLAAVLDRPEPWLAGMEIHELLRLPRRSGIVGVSSVLRRAQIWPLSTVGSLTLPMRSRLLEMLEGPPSRPVTEMGMAVLEELAAARGPLTAGEIADAIGVKGSTLGATLGVLASRGLACRAGRRGCWQLWAVTVEGRSVLSEAVS